MKSDCKPGMVSLSVDDQTVILQQSSVYLNTTYSQIMIGFLTTKRSNDFNIIATGSGGTVKLNIQYDAIDWSPVYDENNFTFSNQSDDTTTSLGSFKGFWNRIANFFDEAFLGKGGWLHILVTVFTIIVIVVLFIWCAPNIFKFLGFTFKRIKGALGTMRSAFSKKDS
jgi:hypothetical protein